MGSTALSAAFERKGITPRDAEMQVALAKFQNNGGTYERLIELARAAYGLPGEATSFLPQGPLSNASTRQQNGDEEGQSLYADKAPGLLPSSSPTESDGAGHSVNAGDGQFTFARPVGDIRPSDAARVLQPLSIIQRRRTAEEKMRTLRTAHGVVVKALMKIDGIDIRDYSIGQALTAARGKDSEAYVLRVLGMMYKHVPHTTRIGDIASDATIESIIRQSKEYSNAAAA